MYSAVFFLFLSLRKWRQVIKQEWQCIHYRCILFIQAFFNVTEELKYKSKNQERFFLERNIETVYEMLFYYVLKC